MNIFHFNFHFIFKYMRIILRFHIYSAYFIIRILNFERKIIGEYFKAHFRLKIKLTHNTRLCVQNATSISFVGMVALHFVPVSVN